MNTNEKRTRRIARYAKLASDVLARKLVALEDATARNVERERQKTLMNVRGLIDAAEAAQCEDVRQASVQGATRDIRPYRNRARELMAEDSPAPREGRS
jgi:hypothetical protein